MSLIQDLLANQPVINPSLLAADFTKLGSEIQRLEEAGAQILHLDIMDGHFVPNLSMGIPIVQSIRQITDLPLDVHLMLDNPADFLVPFRNAGADLLTVHIEVLPDPRAVLERIRDLGAIPGLSLNPPTPLETVLPFLDYCDLLLNMSVMPGFGGQKFDQTVLEKIRVLDAYKERTGSELVLSIDGGINEETIGQAAQAGTNLLVAGTAVFKANDYFAQMTHLRNLARGLTV
ncbi:MAG: ribulose-phosphate 3-epimerase [Thermoguttaceae bacterium]